MDKSFHIGKLKALIASTYPIASIAILLVCVFGTLFGVSINIETARAIEQQQIQQLQQPPSVQQQQQQRIGQRIGTINGVGTSELIRGICTNFNNNDFLSIQFDASLLLSPDGMTGKVTSGTGLLKTTYSNVFGYLSITDGTVNIGVKPELYSLGGTATFQPSSSCNLPSTVKFSIAKPDGTQLKCGNTDLIMFNSVPLTGTISGNVICTSHQMHACSNVICPTQPNVKDTTAPNVIATLSPKMADSQKGTRVHPVTITWSGDDGPGGSGVSSCDSPTSYSGPDGSSILLVGHCMDKSGNVGIGSVIISYDANSPNINIPGPITKEATDATGATVAYTVSASDAIDGTFYITSGCFPASGSIFKFGTTTVTCKAADSAGNVAASKAFAITVQHTTPPQNVKIISSLDKPSNSITFQLSRPTDITGITSLQCSIDASTASCPPSGSVSYSNLHPGSHTFIFAAKDAAGNSAFDRFSWTIPADMAKVSSSRVQPSK